jgi:hypothetical protein
MMETPLKKISWRIILSALLAVAVSRQTARADSVIAPFVDAQTSAVIHVDFSQLDLDQLDAWVQKSVAQISDPVLRAQQQQDSKKNFEPMRNWVNKFKTAGGKDLYIAISLAGIIQGSPGGMIVPLNGADPAALAKVINPSGNPPPPDPNDPNAAQQQRMLPQTVVVGNALVMSTGAGIDKLKTASSQPRQDLADALAAGGDSTLHLVFTPASLKDNPLFGAMVMSRFRTNPQQPPFGDPHWDSVTWMSISFAAPPKESGNCTIQCKDSDSAAALADYLNQQLQDAKTGATSRPSGDADDIAKLVDAAKPTVSGTQVVISLDQKTIDTVVGPMLTKQMSHAPRPVREGPMGPPPADNNAPTDNNNNGM